MTSKRDLPPTPRTSGPHYCEGDPEFNQTAFVFSVPGKCEEANGKPVSGLTGENLKVALHHLQRERPDIFGTDDRYRYRITNAYWKSIFARQDNGRTEATQKQVHGESNLSRLLQELGDCSLVVLCGVKAQSVGDYLRGRLPDLHQIKVPHIGLRGLQTFNDENIWAIPNARDRTEARLRAWSRQVLEGCPYNATRRDH